MGLFDCFKKKKNLNQIISAPTWMIEQPQPPRTLDGELWTIDIPQVGSVNYVTRPAPVLTDKKRIDIKIKFEGRALARNSNGKAKLTLYMQRKGDDWSAQGPMAGYRFYGANSLYLQPGELEFGAELAPGNWRNVYGQQDEAAFRALLADPARIGFVLGDPGTGNTGHGIYGDPSAKITLRQFMVS